MHTYTDHPTYELPDPHVMVKHLQDRLAGVAADALQASIVYKCDLPTALEDYIARANTELAVWERRANIARCNRETPEQARVNREALKKEGGR